MSCQRDYKAVSWKNLTIALFDRFPAECQLDIIKQQEWQIPYFLAKQKGVKLRLAIIGASHLVEFRSPDQTFTEVFSCQRKFDNLPLKTLQLVKFKGDEYSPWQYTMGESSYSVYFKRFHEGTIDELELDVFIKRCPFKIRVDFPKGECDGIPFTAVGAIVLNGCLIIKSIHGYNHEKTIILSESVLKPWSQKNEDMQQKTQQYSNV